MSKTHFVKITFKPLSEAEMDVLLSEDERLNELFSDSAAVEYDGYERGKDDFVMFFYGASADTMAPLIVAELKKLPFADRGVVFKRYGDNEGAREESVKLAQAFCPFAIPSSRLRGQGRSSCNFFSNFSTLGRMTRRQ